MNKFDEKEFNELKNILNTDAKEIDYELEYPGESFLNRMKDSVANDRRGEVVFGVVRPNGKLILVTCEDYPKGIYRVPTGGINYGEDILAAVKRETMEELGLKTEILSFGGVIKLKFSYKGDSEMFYCYLFLLKEVSGKLLEDATDVEVSQVLEADYDTACRVHDDLNNIKGKWADWGKFRAVTTKAIAELYNDYLSK
jgi:ADP-ribose pyrophosphatase YjhB (NUDIX family)